MASASVNDGHSYNSIDDDSSFDNMRVLLVDDDVLALVIVGAVLRECRYEVTTAKSAHRALEILREKKEPFDFVVCDLHMPVMGGFELLLIIKKEFQLPVIMTSADDNMSVMAKSLLHGASFFLNKPVGKEDVEHLWQYAVIAKKERPVNVAENNVPEDTNSEILCQQNMNDENLSRKRKPDSPWFSSPSREEQVQEVTVLDKKKRMVWTSALHGRFLDAIKEIGLPFAGPKEVLALMNVPGLTRAHVASHLQNYRMVLTRLAEKELVNSRFAAGLSSQLLEDAPATFRRRFGMQPMRLASQGRNHGIGMEPNIYAYRDQPVFPNLQQTFNTLNSVPQLQYDKSNAASGAQLLFPDQLQACNSTINPVNAASNVMTWPDMIHVNPSSLDGANTGRRQHPVANPRSLAAWPMNSHVNNENTNLTYAQEKQNLASVGIANLGWNPNPPLSNNYSGVQELNAGTGLKDVGLATGSFNSNYELLNETENGGIILTPMGDGTSGYMVEEDSSSKRGSRSASQFLPVPAELAKLPTQLQRQYGAGNSGGISDIVTSSMINVERIDEDKLDGDELIRYFLDLESNGFSKNYEQLAEYMMMNHDYVNNSAELPNIDGEPNHLLGSTESEQLLNIQPQGTSTFVDIETSAVNGVENAEPVSNPSPQQDWDMELLIDMLVPDK